MTTKRKETDNMEKIIEDFNSFIKKWCGSNFPHLIDSDENDGERFRQKIEQAILEAEKRGRNEVLESVEKELQRQDNPSSNSDYNSGYNQALSEVKSIIQTHKV